jgi:O-antigen/teichoic acid export membrane protein
VGKFVLLGTWFFLTPFILDQVGASAYGVWVLVGSLVSYGSLFDFGMAGAITKYVAEFHGHDDEKAHRLIATTLRLYTLLGVIVILVSVLLAPLFPIFFNLPASEKAAASWVVFLSGVGLGISLPSGTTTAVLRGLQRFDLINVLSVTGMLSYAILLVVVLKMGGGIVGMALVNIPFTLVMQIPAIIMIRRIAPELRFGWRDAEMKYVRAVTSFSSALFVIEVASQLKTKADEVIIGAFLPISLVTPYYFAHRLSEIPQLLTDQFMKVLMPLSSQMHSQDDSEVDGSVKSSVRQLYVVSTRITLAIFVAVGVTLAILAKPFLAVWVGVEYTQYVGLVYLLTAASFMEILTWPAGAVLQGMAKHHLLAPIAIGSGVVNVILSILLIKPLGLSGIALATLIPNVVEGMFLVLPYTMRTLKISGQTMIREVLLPVVPPAIVLVVVLLLLSQSIALTSFIAIGFVGGIGVMIYLALYVALGKKLEERNIILNMLYSAYKSNAVRARL